MSNPESRVSYVVPWVQSLHNEGRDFLPQAHTQAIVPKIDTTSQVALGDNVTLSNDAYKQAVECTTAAIERQYESQPRDFSSDNVGTLLDRHMVAGEFESDGTTHEVYIRDQEGVEAARHQTRKLVTVARRLLEIRRGGNNG